MSSSDILFTLTRSLSHFSVQGQHREGLDGGFHQREHPLHWYFRGQAEEQKEGEEKIKVLGGGLGYFSTQRLNCTTGPVVQAIRSS